jgi:hypothetical protein
VRAEVAVTLVGVCTGGVGPSNRKFAKHSARMTLGALYHDIAVTRGHIRHVLEELAARHGIEAGELDRAMEAHIDELLSELVIYKVKREVEPTTKSEDEH